MKVLEVSYFMYNYHDARRRLEELEDELITDFKKQKKLERDIRNLYEQKRYAELVEAGKVVEEAGLLGKFNKNDLYLLLVMHKNELLKKG